MVNRLFEAIRKDDAPTVAELIANGVDVNDEDEKGMN